MKVLFPPMAALLLLGGCGGNSASEQTADNLEEAAEQSDPAAAAVLDNAAESIRDNEGGDANATAQAALQEAGNAQAPSGTTTGATPGLQAEPHEAGEGTPPAKTAP